MKLKTQVLIFLSIIILIIISSGIFLSFFISDTIYSESLQNTIDKNSSFIRITAESTLNNDDFTSKNYEQKQIIFSNFFKTIDTSEILRIKVWSLDGTVIYSDNKNIVGKNFVDNPNFQNSLSGQIIAEIKNPEKPENISEKGYGQLMEIYVPIMIGNEISGIIETYVSLDNVNEHVGHTNQIIFTIFLLILFILIIIILMIYFLIHKRIIVPIKILQLQTTQISDDEFNIDIKSEWSEEIQNLASDVQKMSKKIISQQNNLIKNERMKAIGQISSRIAHDIRNPISIISVSAENLKILYAKNDKKIVQIDKIERSVDRIIHQVNGVLDFIKGQHVELKIVMMSEIITESIDSISIPDKIKLILPTKDVQLFCDKRQFVALMSNLILNSIQEMDDSGMVEIIVDKEKDEIKIQVKDSGKGILKENLPHIFEPLFTTKEHGTGLGLSGVKSIIEAHGGTISVTSPPTIFTVILPNNLVDDETKNDVK